MLLNKFQVGRVITEDDSYYSKIIKYIHSEIVAGYIAISGILAGRVKVLQENQEDIQTVLYWWWGVVLFFLFLTPIYAWYTTRDENNNHVAKKSQIILAPIAFSIWVFGLGKLMNLTFSKYEPYMGSVILILGTLFLPLIGYIIDKTKLLKNCKN